MTRQVLSLTNSFHYEQKNNIYPITCYCSGFILSKNFERIL